MRNVCQLLAFAVLFSTLLHTAQAQPNQPNFWNTLESAFVGPDGQNHFLLSDGNINASIPYLGVLSVDGAGPQSSYHFLLAQGIPHHLEMLPLPDGFLLAGSFFQCDIDIDWKLYRFNKTGELLWEKDLGIQTNARDTFKILPGPNGGFWLFRPNEVPLRYDANGAPGQPGFYPFPLFSGFRSLPNGKTLVFGEAGLGVFSQDLYSLSFGMPNTVFLSAVPLPNGHFAALSADSLFLVDGNLQPIAQTALNFPPETAIELCYAGGRLHLLAITEPRQLVRMDTANLNVLETITVPLNAPFQPRFILQSQDDRLLLAGYEYAFSGLYAQVLDVREAEATAMPDFGSTADAGVATISMTAPLGHQTYGVSPSYGIKIDSVFVWVKNEGSAVLETVTLNSVLNTFSWYCGPQSDIFWETYTGFHIAPGDSMRFDLGKIAWFAPGFIPGTYVELCFWTTLPNDSLDAVAANNATCRTMPIIVGTNTPLPKVEQLTISPNPASDRATITWKNSDFEPVRIQVFNGAGTLVKTANVQTGAWEFERGALPAGLYHILIRNTENGQLFAGRLLWHQ